MPNLIDLKKLVESYDDNQSNIYYIRILKI